MSPIDETTPPVGVPLPNGQRAGRYQLEGILGMGAMGVVYAAYDPELGRRLAIKILRTTQDTLIEERRRRFVREAKSLARVVHPNVVAIYDVGQIDDQVFIAMELVEGGTLRDWLQGEHDLPRTLALFEEIGRGLNAVHKAGLVHRDFKPENVLLDRDGRPRVTDFGLARGELTEVTPALGTTLPPAAGPTRLSLTETGPLLGTPAYMAPEQLRGAVPDARADLFAFCVALWEALFGARPFAGASVAELLASIEAQRFVRPPPPRAGARVASLAMSVLMRGLRATPSQRLATLDELLAQLRRVQQPPRRPWRWVAGGLLGMAIFGAVPATLVWRARERARCEKNQTIPGWSPLRDRLRTKLLAAPTVGRRSLGEQLVKLLDQYAGDLSETRRAVCEATYVSRAQSERAFDAQMDCLGHRQQRLLLLAESVLEEPTLSPQATDLVGNLHRPQTCRADGVRGRRPTQRRDPNQETSRLLAVAQTQLNLSHVRDAEDAYRRARAAALLLGDVAMLAEATLGLGQCALVLGRLDESRPLLDEGTALALTAQEGWLAHSGYLLQVQLAWRQHHDVDEAERATRLFRWLTKRNPYGRELEGRLLAELAGVYRSANRLAEAQRALDEGLKLPDVPLAERAHLEHSLGDLYLDMGKLDEAQGALAASYEHAVAASGVDSSSVLSIESSRIYLAYTRGGAAAAIPPAERLVAQLDRFGDDLPLQLVDALQNLSAYLAQVDRDQEALAASARAVKIAQTHLAPRQAARIAAEAGYASSLVDVERFDEARPYLDRLLPIVDPAGLERADAPVSEQALDVRFTLARLEARRNPTAARAHLARARQIAALYPTRADVQAILLDLNVLAAKLHVN